MRRAVGADGVSWATLCRRHGRLRQAVTLLAMTCGLLVVGLWMQRLNAQRAAAPAELEVARSSLEAMGGAAGIEERRAKLLEIERDLLARRDAAGGDAAAYSRRIDELFARLGVDVTAASDWRPADPEIFGPAPTGGGALFVRNIQGRGSSTALWTALHSLESWPDPARVHALRVEPLERGRVELTLELVVYRGRPATDEPTGAGAVS